VHRLLGLALVLAILVAGLGLAVGVGGIRLPAGSDAAIASRSALGSPVPPGGSPGPSLARGPSPGPLPSPTPLPSPSPTPPPLPTDRLQAALDAWRTSTGTPGVSASIRWGDGRTWTGASGTADTTRRAPLVATSAFPLASISKTFTAALILQLVEEGRLKLDDPVAPRLPGLGLDVRITVKMLLDHTSGLPDLFLAPGIDQALLAAPDRVWSLSDSLAYARKARTTPGTAWAYSNTGYLLLGVLAERVTGQSFATLLRTRFFTPLGLATTYVQIAERARGPIALGHLVSRTGSKWTARVVRPGDVQPFRSVVSAGGAADDVAASAADVARWAALLYGGSVLRPASVAAMLGDVANVSKLRPRIAYGLGVEQTTLAPWGAAYGHDGHLIGFHDLVRYLPVPGLSIATLANVDKAPVGPLLTTLLSIALPLGEPCARCR
jgi:D-alanyl-D-alanine carboxypeptidase